MDAASLYREEIYTDRKIGTLRVLLPVKSDGSPDAQRRTLYQGEAQLMTNVGPLPISFDIDADNLADAVAKYGEATQAGIERSGAATKTFTTALAAATGESEGGFSDVHVEGLHLRVLTAPLGDIGAVQVARPLDDADRVLDFTTGAGATGAVELEWGIHRERVGKL